jgi:hypothetical protein
MFAHMFTSDKCQYENKLIIIIVVLILLIFLIFCQNDNTHLLQHPFQHQNAYEYEERFVANYDSDIDLFDINKDGYKLVDNYMTVTEFSKMTNQIKLIVSNEIIKYGKQCQAINGEEKDKIETQQLTLNCQNDVVGMEKDIIYAISNYVIDYIKNRYHIDINPYQIINNFYIHLDLKEDIIYPLLYSNLYTINGIQYFSKHMARKIVNENLHIDDLLYTTITRRGIIVIIDDDKNIS